MGDLDDTRKLAAGDGPEHIAHIICLCPEQLADTPADTLLRPVLLNLCAANVQHKYEASCNTDAHIVQLLYGTTSSHLAGKISSLGT